MKISKEVVEKYREYISEFDTEAVRESYRTGKYPRSEHTKDVNRRYRWDLFWCVNDTYKVYNDLIEDDFNDSHIDTMLRNIVSPL